jgi:hypothetical protein
VNTQPLAKKKIFSANSACHKAGWQIFTDKIKQVGKYSWKNYLQQTESLAKSSSSGLSHQQKLFPACLVIGRKCSAFALSLFNSRLLSFKKFRNV